MKKTLIAGAASVALAAMPVVGVFATNQINGSPITDTFTINVTDACTFARKVVSSDNGHAAGAIGNMTNAGWTTAGTSADVFAADVVAGNTYDGFAKSAFQITCNNAVGGYKVTAATNSLGTGEGAIEYSGFNNYKANGSSWYLTSTGAGAAVSTSSESPVTNPVVWKYDGYNGTTITDKLSSDDFEITYNLKVDGAQPVGTYTGTVSYALSILN